MAAIIGKAWRGYQFLFEELADPRTKGWLLVAKPYQTLTIVALYLFFVLKWGPKFMKNRQPYDIEKILIVYNVLQVAACMYVFVQAVILAWGWDYKWICEPVDFSNNPRALEIASTVYYYYALKIIDLLDTIFFVLRKKFNQVSFLHIYHHTGMVLLIWGAVTYLPGGHATLVGVINSLVHVVMYTYYLLSVAVPSIKNELWIKKFVTQLQIVQFFWCVVHMGALVFKTDCEYPRWTSALFLPQNLFMLVLFIDFYIKTYIKKPREQLRAQTDGKNVSTQSNGTKNSSIYKNGVTNVGTANGIHKINNDAKNEFSKVMNGHDSEIFNSHYENGKIFENSKDKSGCASGKCKMDCQKHYKNE